MLIRSKILLVNTLIIAAGLLIFGYSIFTISGRPFRAGLEQELSDALHTLLVLNNAESRTTEPGHEFDLDLPSSDSPFFYVALCNSDGQVVKKSDNYPPDLDLSLADPPHENADYFHVLTYGGRNLLTISVPLYDLRAADYANAQPVAFLRVARLYDNLIAFERVWYLVLLTTVAGILLSLAMGGLSLYYIHRPFDELGRAALQIYKSGDLSVRLPDFGESNEVGRLALVLNRVLGRVESLFRMQQRMLTDVSHELRTPLTTIQGNLELMERMGVYHPDMLADAQDDVARMTRLVDDLMLLVRADVGGLPLQRHPVQLDTVFLDVFRRMKPLANNVELALEELDQVCVLGDADRLKQLILNLVDNGLKYTPPGGKVSMRLSKLNGIAQVVIADTGIGIANDDLPHIFDRFYRADKARTGGQAGSGLGLSIARWLAEAHKGRIQVESQLGDGTTFTLFLPVATVRDSR